MKPRSVALLIVLVIVVLGVTLALSLSHGNKGGDACQNTNTSPTAYTITIRDNKASATTIQGKLCDTLTFKNLDNITREIAFGPHEHHIPYDGIAERVLNKDESFTITFDKAGTYHWHDHLHDEINGSFTVSN